MLTQADIRRKARVALILRARRRAKYDGDIPPDGVADDGTKWEHPAPPRPRKTPSAPRPQPKPGPPPSAKPALPKKASPTAAEASKWHRSLRGLEDIVSHIDSGEKKRYPLSEGRMGETHLVDHNDGSSTIEKLLQDVSDTLGPDFRDPRRQADAEQLAALLGQAIGATVPRVLRTAPDKVSVEIIEGATWSTIEREIPNPDDIDKATLLAVREQVVASREGVVLGVFDLLIANWDRSRDAGSNWMIGDNDRKPYGIDHAFAWSDDDFNDGPDTPPPGHLLSVFAHPFFAAPTPAQLRWSPNGNPPLQWTDNPLTPADIAWLRTRLAALEDDFARLGRHDWWEFAMGRLEVLAQHAAGSEGVFT